MDSSNMSQLTTDNGNRLESPETRSEYTVWLFEKFDGQKDLYDIKMFLRFAQSHAKLHDVAMEKIAPTIIFFLEGKALDKMVHSKLWSQIEDNDAVPWNKFKDDFINLYSSSSEREGATTEFFQIYQKGDESVDEYLFRFNRALVNTGDILPDSSVRSWFLRSLQPHIRQYMPCGTSLDNLTIDELFDIAQDIDWKSPLILKKKCGNCRRKGHVRCHCPRKKFTELASDQDLVTRLQDIRISHSSADSDSETETETEQETNSEYEAETQSSDPDTRGSLRSFDSYDDCET